MADRSARDGEREIIGTRADFERSLDHWKLLISAALVGLSATAQDIALKYVMERKAFGRPIGAFQVIQHGLADFPAWIDGARTLVHKAAWATDAMISQGCQSDPDPDGAIDTVDFEILDPRVLTSMAFSFATESAAKVTDRALHYHGSYGFSLEYDIQLFYRRARGWPLQLGNPAAERARVADILWPLSAT
jgi:alkylation response protein AidB-like acyl-CoA dehydrogenase